MKRKFSKYAIASLVIVTTLLLIASIVSAGWSAHTSFMTDFENGDLCTDSFGFGMADEGEHTYDIYFYRVGEGPEELYQTPYEKPANVGNPVGSKEGVEIQPEASAPSEYCDPFPVHDNPGSFTIDHCGGTTVDWVTTLDAGIELEMWVFDRSSGDNVGNGGGGPVLPEPDRDFVVRNCNPANIRATLLQTESGSTATTVSTDLVFEVSAYDQNVGASNGAGIQSVNIRIIGPNGVVRQHTEYNVPYCAFGGNSPCPIWVFADHDNEWPGGQAIQSGSHTLEVTVNTDAGPSSTFTWTIDIELPLETNLTQTGPGTTASVVTDTLVFQLGAHTGIGNDDGDGIQNVNMRITGPGGVEVHQRTEYNAGYCVFGGGEPNCNLWVFSDHNNEWPGGQPLQHGLHRLQATVNTDDGRNETVEYSIIIDDSAYLVFLPLIMK